MRRAVICLVTLCVFGFVGFSSASAADDASTVELPAALKALEVKDTQVLTKEQAQEVRGEGLFWVGGGVFVHNYVAYGVVYHESYEPVSVRILLTPYQFGIRVSR